jgi:TonB family protein
MFDMLLESGHRSALPSWGKCVALTLHVLVLGALWRAPASPASVPSVRTVEVFPPELVTPSRVKGLPPPNPDCQCETITVPPVEIPRIPDGALNTQMSAANVETRGNPTSDGSTLFGSTGDVVPVALVQDAPELLTAPTPVYPPLLRAAGVQGRVIVAAVVDTMGQAETGSVRIVLSDNPGFDRAALATVRAARFRPARIYGRAVRVLVQVPVVFRLS